MKVPSLHLKRSQPGLADPARESEPTGSILAGVGRDVAWSYMSVLAVGITALLTPAIVIRAASAESYGVYALVTAAIALVAPLDTALGLFVSRSVARERTVQGEKERAIHRADVMAARRLYRRTAFLLLAAAWFLAVVVSAGWISFSSQPRFDVAALIGSASASFAVVLATGHAQGVLLGHRLYRTTGAAAIAGALTTVLVLVVGVTWRPLIAIGGALLLGTLVNRLILVARANHVAPWIRSWRVGDGDPANGRTRAFAVPLVLMGAGAQVVTTTDIFIIGWLLGSSEVALYRVASMIPTQLVTLVYRGVDASFPALAAQSNDLEGDRAVREIARISCYVVGVVFGVLAVVHDTVIAVIAGHPSRSAGIVLVLFCAVWAVNSTTHPLSILLISRAQQRIVAPVVALEAGANLLLTIVLVVLVGPVGAALATLLTITLSNLVFLPLLVRNHVEGVLRLIFADGGFRVLLGTGVGVGMSLPLSLIAPGGGLAAALIAVFGVCAGLAVGALAAGSGGRSSLRIMFGRPAPPITSTASLP